MRAIIKLDRRHSEQMALIDFLSEHQNSSKYFKRNEMRKAIEERFAQG